MAVLPSAPTSITFVQAMMGRTIQIKYLLPLVVKSANEMRCMSVQTNYYRTLINGFGTDLFKCSRKTFLLFDLLISTGNWFHCIIALYIGS